MYFRLARLTDDRPAAPEIVPRMEQRYFSVAELSDRMLSGSFRDVNFVRVRIFNLSEVIESMAKGYGLHTGSTTLH
jgi:hypothetical protein